MKNHLKKIVFFITLSVASAAYAEAAKAADKSFVTIGTGGQTGVYYAVGTSICRLINKKTAEHGVRCTAESTGGSIYNLNTISKKPKINPASKKPEPELDFAVAQSDWQYHAVKGSKNFKSSGPIAKLRSVFSIHPEPFTVVARKDANIKTIADLKGKRVNIGNPGSGARATFDVVARTMGWTKKDFKYTSELKQAERGPALCDNKVDAIVYNVGHPNGSVQETTTTCDAVLVDVSSPQIKKLVSENSFYAFTEIPGGLYRGNEKATKTFGVKATFVSTTDTSPDTVEVLVSAVFDNFSLFRKLHPAFNHLKPKDMIYAGNSAPLHDGAKRYFKSKGWLTK